MNTSARGSLPPNNALEPAVRTGTQRPRPSQLPKNRRLLACQGTRELGGVSLSRRATPFDYAQGRHPALGSSECSRPLGRPHREMLRQVWMKADQYLER